MSAGSLILVRALSDATRLEDAAGLVVEVHGSGERVGLRPPLHHDHTPSPLRKQDRQRGTHRAVADDGDVDHVVGWPGVGCLRRAHGLLLSVVAPPFPSRGSSPR